MQDYSCIVTCLILVFIVCCYIVKVYVELYIKFAGMLVNELQGWMFV